MNGQDGGDTVHEDQTGEHFAAPPQSGSKKDGRCAIAIAMDSTLPNRCTII